MKKYYIEIGICFLLIFLLIGCNKKEQYDDHTIVLGVLSGGG